MKQQNNVSVKWLGVAGIIALVVIVSLITVKLATPSGQNKAQSVADKVINNGEIRIGYIVYPPLLSKDQTTGKLSGVSYDIIEEAAKRLNIKTNWTEEVGWGSALEGLKTKRYDLLGTQMWPSSARAREAVFSIGPMNSVLYPYVRAGDNRFNNDLSKINSSDVTISAVDGELSTFIAAEDYPNAKLNTLPQTASYAEVFLNIVNKKGDVEFAEPSAANDFLKSNPGKIQQVGNTPVRKYGLDFAFARGEDSMVNMWNVPLNEMINDGSIYRILQKYGVATDYSINK